MIDSASERIIRYLSNTHGVDINAATFQYFRDSNGSELLGRVFLIDPTEVAQNTVSRGSSKRKPNLTQEELREIAEQNGVIDEYDAILSMLRPHFEGMRTTRSGVNLLGSFEGGRGTVVNLIPGESSVPGGIHVQLYTRRVAEHAGVPIEMITGALPYGMSPWTLDPNGDEYWSGLAGFLRPEDVWRLVEQVFVGAARGEQTALPAVESLAR